MPENVMLAHEYKEDQHKSLVSGWWISEKYDGVRGLWDHTTKTMTSRAKNEYTMPEFIIKQFVSSGMTLDGEIWFGRDTFDICSGAARKGENDEELWKTMTFMVFDGWKDEKDYHLPFEERIEKVKKAIKGLDNIRPIEFYKFDPQKTTIQDELKKVENKGGEGLVLRKPNSKYEFKRSKNMLKVKSWFYEEAVVIGYNKGTGKYKNMVGSLKIENEKIGKFKVGSGLNDWQRGDGLENSLDDKQRKKVRNQQKFDSTKFKELVHIVSQGKGSTHESKKKYVDSLHNLNKMYTCMPVIGDVITYRYKETTKDGKPKFPTFVTIRDYE